MKQVDNIAENEIAKIYEGLDQILLREDIDFDKISYLEFDKLKENLSFDLFVYENNKLIFWNENMAVPDLDIENLSEKAKQINLKNGYYVALKKEKNGREYVALSLIRTSYYLVNKYLNNNFSKQFPFDESDVILPAMISKGSAIKDPEGNVIFRVLHGDKHENDLNVFLMIVSVLLLILYSYFFVKVSLIAEKKYNVKIGILIYTLFGLLGFLAVVFIPFEFKKLVLFSPQIYGAGLFTSFGYLFLFVLYMFGVVYYIFSKIVRVQIAFDLNLKIAYSLASILLYLLSNIVLRSIILDSIISFDAKNLILLKPYSILGLILAFLICLVFLFAISSLVFILKKQRNFHSLFFGYFVLELILLKTFNFGNLSLGLSLLFLFTAYFLHYKLNKSEKPRLFLIISMGILFAVLQVSSVSKVYADIKNDSAKKVLATKHSKRRDITAEDLYSKVSLKIKDDSFIKGFFQDPIISFKDIYKRMNFLYFGGYFSKFDINITPLSVEGVPTQNSDEKTLEYYDNLIKQYGDSCLTENLFFIQNSSNTNYYISLLKIQDEGKLVGTLAVEILPKSSEIGNVYPELLLEGKNNIIDQYSESYQYAIYQNNMLVDQSEQYNYPADISKLEKLSYTEGGFEHSVYKVSDYKSIIISTKEEKFVDLFSVFSFVLVFYILLGISIFFIYYFITRKQNSAIFKISYRKKLSFSMLSLVVLSFSIIATANLSYFAKQYANGHQDILISKQKSIKTALKYVIQDHRLINARKLNSYFKNLINKDISEISNIHKMDVNLFNLNGELLASSQDGIFSSGLLSSVMNPTAYFKLKKDNKSLIMQEEKIGNLKYLSAYVPILNEEGQKMAFLNIPYFAKEKNLDDDISVFMISIVNLYVLLLIIASIVSFFVSNSITNPLKQISTKLQEITLTKQNEFIDWESEDEIGALVKEYNKMIVQLEQNARLLAKSERDSAWREMAKQIAHEIKNPLTPMKLSIQYLQRALSDDPERAVDLAKRVSNTLIEQIDNLSDIATAFSSFAKMPKGDNTEVNLIRVVDSAVDLFNQDHIQLQKNYQVENAFVFADANQMISVFNNLVKNAKEATQELDKPQIMVEIKEQNLDYIVSIADNGIGIAKEKRAKVFVPNFTTKSSGTGLGLAISKQIINNLNGEIWFESEEEKGTIFYVKIPKFITN